MLEISLPFQSVWLSACRPSTPDPRRSPRLLAIPRAYNLIFLLVPSARTQLANLFSFSFRRRWSAPSIEVHFARLLPPLRHRHRLLVARALFCRLSALDSLTTFMQSAVALIQNNKWINLSWIFRLWLLLFMQFPRPFLAIPAYRESCTRPNRFSIRLFSPSVALSPIAAAAAARFIISAAVHKSWEHEHDKRTWIRFALFTNNKFMLIAFGILSANSLCISKWQIFIFPPYYSLSFFASSRASVAFCLPRSAFIRSAPSLFRGCRRGDGGARRARLRLKASRERRGVYVDERTN